MTALVSDNTTETTSLEEQLLAAGKEYEDFRAAVREAVLTQHRQDKWCLPGSNDVLKELDLPLIQHTYTGWVQISVQVTVNSAANTDEAATLLRDQLNVTSTGADVSIGDFTVEQYADERLNQQSDPR